MVASRNKTEIRARAVATDVAIAVTTAVATLAAQLRARLPEKSPLWVGLSGGRDSVVLLHLCQKALPPGRVRALHVHHGLSPHADAWAAFCEQLCRDWGIPYTLKKVEVPRHDGQGVEAAARHARYLAFQESDAEYLALAHHRRDQAETLLFNLCRGAGVIGAAAMPHSRQIGNLTLLRPLLDLNANVIAAYAAAEQLRWVEDESNADIGYSRNFLRHQILPELTTRFPAAESALARAARHFAVPFAGGKGGDVGYAVEAVLPEAQFALRESQCKVAVGFACQHCQLAQGFVQGCGFGGVPALLS
ncbi:hypothetical protein FACS1894185_5110 [Betaproteobacteria bacterium]|nr:hypothetical protein FACS1894185_5110 [Betaproteobacteria bacterium]